MTIFANKICEIDFLPRAKKLEVIVKCGINAPSGMNRQPWVVRVVEDWLYSSSMR